MKYFLHPIGSFACGKSTLVGSIGLTLGIEFKKGVIIHKNDKCCIIGRYKFGNNGFCTGGMDAIRATNVERFAIIESEWNSDVKLLCVEGTIINQWSTFFRKYQELNSNRKCIVLYLDTPEEIAFDRITERSGRKELTQKRIDNVLAKKKGADRIFELSLRENPDFYICKKMRFVNEHDHRKVLEWIQSVTKLDLSNPILRGKEDLRDNIHREKKHQTQFIDRWLNEETS